MKRILILLIMALVIFSGCTGKTVTNIKSDASKDKVQLTLIPYPAECTVGKYCTVPLVDKVSGGSSPYHFQSDTYMSGTPPLGMTIDLMNGYLKGTPAKEGAYTFGICAVDVGGSSSCKQTTVTVNEAQTEIFEGTFSGPFGITSGGGSEYSNSLSGTITLTLSQNNDGTISGTADVPTDIGMVVTKSPPNMNIIANPFSVIATGTVSGTNEKISGTFVSTDVRPLNIVFTGARNGNEITGSMTITKTFRTWWDINGNSGEVFKTLSTTISNIVLTKQQ